MFMIIQSIIHQAENSLFVEVLYNKFGVIQNMGLCMDQWMDRWMDGWDEWIDGSIDPWMDE